MMSTPSNSLSPIHLLDGGLGTTLADQHGCIFNDSTPLWSSQLLLTSPSTLREAQTSFARAGADVILSATYQASFEGFATSGVNALDAAKVMRSAVGIARDAFKTDGIGEGSGRSGKVALSLGAYGATMIPSQEYSGRYDGEHVTVEQLREWHFRRIGAFFPVVEGFEESREGNEMEEKRECWREVDFMAFETLPLLQEIVAVREVMGAVDKLVDDGQQRESWISCVFPGEGNRLPDGSTVKEVVRAMLEPRDGAGMPMGVGINCTKIGKLESLIEEFEATVEELIESEEVKERPSLVVYPDGTNGEVYDTTSKEWERKTPSTESSISWEEALFNIVRRSQGRGMWKSIFVGGCCKTTPADIRKLRKIIYQN